ncbi:MAG: FG-GAP-like repeat-containing protein [Methylocystis sp.]|uniref:FG-GAP-like repeat-containing protein n=1 Tax=Methylocystis sp. TaxID=1911079 RepID=UPI00394F4080
MGAVLQPVANAASVVVVNKNAAGIGFNDPTPAAPVGGNTGATLGAQRLIAFQAAADIWGALVSSPVPIRVGAQMTPLSCNATSAILGSAGPVNAFRDFTGAPVAGAWYASALANALAKTDLDAAQDDINANFNSNIGTAGCLTTSGWYYGLDSNPPAGKIDFVSVLVHELCHGLGFLTFVDLASGAKALGFNDAFMRFLERHGATPPDYPSMSNAQRVAASIDTGNLHWVGANVRAASGLLTAGKVGDHVRMYAPNPAESGSSVSHWDTAATPNQIMEPIYTQPLHTPILERPLFRDIGWSLTSRMDYNGDGKSDILWRYTNGSLAMWLMNGASVLQTANLGIVPSSWSIAGTGNFNGDGNRDILWRNTSGAVAVWLMNGATVSQTANIGNVPIAWSFARTSDFNGDGKSDLLWRHTSGTVALWLMNGATVLQAANLGVVPVSWTIAGASDFNGDGKNDILWRDAGGNAAIWLMNGATVLQAASLGNVPVSWTIAGTGDFNGDGKGDILWRNSNGKVAIWLMNGAAILQSASIANAPLGWTIAGTGDFNGDGKSDILWRYSNGNVAIWLMSGATVVQNANLGNVPTGWSIGGVNAD